VWYARPQSCRSFCVLLVSTGSIGAVLWRTGRKPDERLEHEYVSFHSDTR
jgi:hypothetical protein